MCSISSQRLSQRHVRLASPFCEKSRGVSENTSENAVKKHDSRVKLAVLPLSIDVSLQQWGEEVEVIRLGLNGLPSLHHITRISYRVQEALSDKHAPYF